MAFIKVHLFTSVEEANQAIELINQGEGIPYNAEAITRTYCDYNTFNDIFYIFADEVTESYLGEPTQLEINSTL
jgi:hypothetical protein